MPSISERWVGRFVDSVVLWPRTVLVIFLGGAAALGWHAQKFKIDAGADTLLTQGNKHYIQTKLADRRFASQEFLLVAYKPRERSVFSQGTLNDLRTLKQKLSQLERVESVRSILDIPLPQPGTLTAGAKLEDWTFERRGFTPKELEAALRGHPIYEDLLINKAQTATALQVLFKKDKELAELNDRITDLEVLSLKRPLSRKERAQLAEQKRLAEPLRQRLDRTRSNELKRIRAIAAEYQGDARIYLGGIHALGDQLVRIITKDLIVFGAAIGGMICLVLLILFRRLRWVFIPALCCVVSVLSTLGLFGLLGFKATVISSSFVALQLILTLAIAVHLIVQYREYTPEHPEWDQEKLVRETLSRKVMPCFYAGITNIVGFASLLFSSLKPVMDFGWMMSIALLLSIVTSLILLPALMMLFPKESSAKPLAVTTRLLDFLAQLSIKYTWITVTASVVVLALGAAGLLRLQVENSFINYFRDTTEVRKELTFIDREFGGTTPLDITYKIPASERKKDLVLTADTVVRLQQLHILLERHKAVGKTMSVANFTEFAKKLNNDKPLTEYELAAMYLTLEKEVRSALVEGFFSPEDSQLRISTRIKDTTPGLNRATLMEGLKADLDKFRLPEGSFELTGLFVLYQDLLQQLYGSQIKTLGVSFGVLALAILLIFRSFKIALICVVPNILSTVIVLGLMGWLGVPLDFMTIMIASIAMGITVDDTIHYIDRYLEELRGAQNENAAVRTQTSVGHALIYTSLIVILGFGLLAFSDFVPSVSFGLLTGLAMALAVLFDLTLLPALLHKFVKSRPRSS